MSHVGEKPPPMDAPIDVPVDASTREQVLDITQSFAVTAPAGSGKTELLTRRFLNLLASCTKPEEILCITFTRKAADEMRHRILKALKSAQDEKPINSHKAQTWDLARKAMENAQNRNWFLLENSGRLQIMTIDSLCQKLSMSMGLESQLGVVPNTTENADILYTQAARNTLRALETDEPLHPALTDFLLHLDNDHNKAENLIAKLLGKREQWWPHLSAAYQQREALQNNTRLLVEQTLLPTQKMLRCYSARLLPLMRFAADNLRDKPEYPTLRLIDIKELPAVDAGALSQWQALAGFFLTDKGTWRKKADKDIGFPADKDVAKEKKAVAKEKKNAFVTLLNDLYERGDILENLQVITRLPIPEYTDKQWSTLEHITHVMLYATNQLKLLFGNQQQSDFTEIALAALRTLGDDENPTDLALRLDYRIQHILVDEFQDTAKPQYDLLARLTQGWQANDGRTLFVVGDGMQSCYGFREANVGIFMKARAHGIGTMHLIPAFLTVNFRSQENIVRWVNGTFAQAFPKKEDLNTGATLYYPSVAAHQAMPCNAVSCYGFIGSKAQKQETEQLQAQQIAQIIQSIRAQNPEDSIAILVRSRPVLQYITPALRRSNIVFQATDIEPLAQKMAVLDALTLTRSLLSITDEMAWMALLRTPWFGLENADLLSIALHRQQHNQTLWRSINAWEKVEKLTSDARKIFARTVPILRASIDNAHRKTLRQHVQGTWQALGGIESLQQAQDHSEALRFFDLLEQHEQGGAVFDTPLFQQALDKLYAAPASMNPSENPVQIMTMHKSKGLEFDHVILPSLGKNSGMNDTPLLLWHEHIQPANEDANTNTERLLIDLLPEISASTYNNADKKTGNTLYSYLSALKKTRENNETLRVLYVACTRAIKTLHLLGSVTEDKKTGELKPAKNTMLASIWPSFSAAVQQWQSCTTTKNTKIDEEENIDDTENDDDAQRNNTGATLTQLQRLPVDWRQPVVTPSTLMAAWRGHEFSGENAEQESKNPLNRPAIESRVNTLARITGTLLHRLLCRITEDGIHNWTAPHLQSQQTAWQAQLLAQGLDNQEAYQQSTLIIAAVQNMIDDERGRWLLNNRHQHSACELALSNANGTHVIDRTFVDQNTRWIIDYKSTTPAHNENIKDFLQNQLATHSAQLQRYHVLFSTLETQPIRCALYFPLAGLWVER